MGGGLASGDGQVFVWRSSLCLWSGSDSDIGNEQNRALRV